MYKGFSRGCKILLAYAMVEKLDDAHVASWLEPIPLAQLTACGLVRVVKGRLRATPAGRTVFRAFVDMGDATCIDFSPDSNDHQEGVMGMRAAPIGRGQPLTYCDAGCEVACIPIGATGSA